MGERLNCFDVVISFVTLVGQVGCTRDRGILAFVPSVAKMSVSRRNEEIATRDCWKQLQWSRAYLLQQVGRLKETRHQCRLPRHLRLPTLRMTQSWKATTTADLHLLPSLLEGPVVVFGNLSMYLEHLPPTLHLRTSQTTTVATTMTRMKKPKMMRGRRCSRESRKQMSFRA